jgi:7,8-dihydropterin-6-yl-methyl-4-(beta-D-ribofuranosyl)aminobenzene 5'-phosphate synthase
MGFAIVEERRPSFVLDGAVLIIGEVDRTTAFETGFQGHEAMRDGEWQADPLILDDQALVVGLGDRGLVILSGCGHAGIVNTVRYARKAHRKRRGRGDHRWLSPQRSDVRTDHRAHRRCARRPLTLASLLVPAHCTGWRAVHRLAGRFPDAFVLSTVGTTVTR